MSSPPRGRCCVDGVDPDVWREALVAAVRTDHAARTRRPAGDRSRASRCDYDGADLDEVARQWGCAVDEVVQRHQEAEFMVAFCGFAPGFAYCTEHSAALPDVPRRDEPRTQVPAGVRRRWPGSSAASIRRPCPAAGS